MSAIDHNRWADKLALVDLQAGEILFGPNQEFNSIYFPLDCIVSLSLKRCSNDYASFALIGNEGVVGASVFLGDKVDSYSAKVECGGKAYRLPEADAKESAAQSSQFRILILDYLQALVVGSLQSAICDSKHTNLQRLSRALLTCDDRLACDGMMLDPQFMATSIGITVDHLNKALVELLDLGLIRVDRGFISALDRAGLEKVTCECYQIIQDGFDRILAKSL